MQLGIDTFLVCLLIGSSAIALWICARFEQVGPRSVTGALANMFLAMVVARCGVLLVPPAIELDNGFYVTSFGVVLPVFVYMFLTAAWLIRVLARTLIGAHR